jgi:phage gp45-like
MHDPHLRNWIQQEIRKHVQIILGGLSGQNTEGYENIEQRLPGMPTITNRPVVHPYGFAARAKRGTAQVTARMGDHPNNVLVLGHRDTERPDDLEEGECVLYTADGQKIYVRKDMVQMQVDKLQIESEMILLGSDSSEENLMLGKVTQDVLKELMSQVETIAQQVADIGTNLVSHTHLGMPLDVPVPFVTAAANATAAKAAISVQRSTKVESGDILSDKAFTEK